MTYTLQAHVLLDKRCILGQGVRLVSTGRFAGKWNPNIVGRPRIGRRNGTITCKSWSNTKPLQRDAHGEWSQGEVSLEKEKKKGRNGNLDLYKFLSLVGYYMLPMVIFSASALFIPPQGLVMFVITALTVLWCTRACSSLLIVLAFHKDEH